LRSQPAEGGEVTVTDERLIELVAIVGATVPPRQVEAWFDLATALRELQSARAQLAALQRELQSYRLTVKLGESLPNELWHQFATKCCAAQMDTYADAFTAVDNIIAERDSLQRDHAASAARVEALAEHARHTPECVRANSRREESAGTTAFNRCECGLDAALAQPDAARPAGEMT
jgi:hypothetical protein